MLLPSIKFNTIVDNSQNIDITSKNRILIAAPFNRGPTDFRYVGSETEFDKMYGNDFSTGAISFRAAYDQGARQYGVVRVLGRGNSAAGEVDFRGISTRANTIYLNLKFISDPVQRSKQALKADMRVGGTYTSDNSGRYWFRVMPLQDNDTFAEIKYVFVPLSSTGYIDWTGATQTSDIGVGIDADFTSELQEAVKDRLDEIDPLFDPAQVNIVAAEKKNWADTCLEINNLGDSCVDLITSGWLVVIENGTNRWTVHTNSSGSLIKIDPLNTGKLGTIPRFVQMSEVSYDLTDVETSEEITTTDLIGKNIAVASRSFYVQLNADQGLPLNISNGMYISFDSVNQTESINLSEGDMWSIRTDAYRYSVDIPDDATPYEVSNAFLSTLSGKDPLGTMILNSSETGVIFYLDDDLKGNIGNKFQYYLEIGELDGEVITDATYFGGTKTIQIPIRLAPFIQAGAEVVALEEGNIYSVLQYSDSNTLEPAVNSNVKNILENGTRVVKVEVPVFNDGTAMVFLNKDIVAPDSNIALFSFLNPDGLLMEPYTKDNIKSMSGGQDGPRFASRELYSLNGDRLVTIQSLYEGAYGNNLEITVRPITQGRFKLDIVDVPNYNTFSDSTPESYIIDLSDTDANGECNTSKSSNLVRVFFTPKALDPERYSVRLEKKAPMRLQPSDPFILNREDPRHNDHYGPVFLRGISLEGGYDGPTPDESDYISALSKAKDQPVNYLLTPGVYESGIIKSTLITQAETASEEEGLRFAVLNASPRVTPNNAAQQTLGFNTKDAVMVGGWSTYSNRLTSKRFNLSPDIVWAGKRATIPYFVQINAPQSSGFVKSVFEVDTSEYISRDSLQIITDARLELLYREADSFGIKFLNDRTLSSSNAFEHVTTVLTEKNIRQDVYRMLKQYLSEPSIPDVYAQIEAQIDNYLADRKRGFYIRGYRSAVVTESPNNKRQITVDFRVTPTPSINEIIINMTLEL